MDTSNGEEEQDGGLSSRKREVTDGDGKGLVAQHVKLLENTIPNAITTSPQKRIKISKAVGEVTNNPLFGSAPSDEEGDRAQ